MILLSVLIRRKPSVFPENLYKVAAVIKAAFQTDGSHRQIGSAQQLGSLLDAVAIHIIQRSLVGNGMKEAAEVLGIHACLLGQSLQRDRSCIVIFDVFQHGLHLVDPMGGTGSFLRIGNILALLQH